MRLSLTVLKDTYAIYQLAADSEIPDWIDRKAFFSITSTPQELSIVCKQSLDFSPRNGKAETGWRILKINGPLDLNLVGVIAHIAAILKDETIPLFTISTYDTDYILVKQEYLNRALTSLQSNGYRVSQ